MMPGSPLAFNVWFCRLLQFSSVESLTDEYRDFGEIGAVVLKMTAQEFSSEISKEKIKDIFGGMTKLNSHPDVPEALAELEQAGLKLVALTNGGKETVDKQLKNENLESYFDAVYSVEAVGKFKQHPAAYHYVLDQEKTKPKDRC